MSVIRIGVVGDHDPTVVAHRANPIALRLAAEAASLRIAPEWVPTEEIQSDARVADYDGLWCVPKTPYNDTDGALRAIRFAREQGRPFLGTCGGFQHAVLEYARNVLGWADAEHAEESPGAARAVIAPLDCALVEVKGGVTFVPGSRLANAYGVLESTEGYHCSYGLNPAFQAALVSGPLRATAHDQAGDVRALELDGHPFYVITLFQPERLALDGRVPPPVAAFLAACAKR